MADSSFGLPGIPMFNLYGQASGGLRLPSTGQAAAQQSLAAIQRAGERQTMLPLATQLGYEGISHSGQPIGTSFQQRQLDTSQANRNQMLRLLGLNQFGSSGGLLGQPFFGSVLGNTLPDVVGGITGHLPGVGVPGGGSGGGGLFGQQIAGRGELGESILGDIAGFGESQRNRIEQDAQNRLGTRLAHLEARGLGGSNIATGEMARTDRERDTQLLGLEDALIGQRVGAKQAIGEGLFGDVGQELNRGVQRSGQAFNLLGNLFSNALNVL